MERHVKERLIGAVVLIAAAIILIPEMLSGPDRAASGEITSGIATVQDGETPLKTYTIDLTKSPATLAAERAIDDRVPPAEAAPATAGPESEPEPAPATATAATQANPDQANPESAPRAAAAAPPTVAAAVPAARQPTTAAVAPRTPSPTPTAKPAPVAATAAKGEAWAVQLGSFANRVTAERMVTTLKAGGHNAFVMPVKSGQATLYRVRIGPMQDRESAAQMQRKVQATVPGAAVVAHP